MHMELMYCALHTCVHAYTWAVPTRAHFRQLRFLSSCQEMLPCVQAGGCHQTGRKSPWPETVCFYSGAEPQGGAGQQVRGRSGARRVLYFGGVSRLLPVIHHPGYQVSARSLLTSALSPMTLALLLPLQPRSSPLPPGPLPGVSPSEAVLFLGLPVPVSGFRAPPSLPHPIQLLKPNPTSSGRDGLDRLLLKPEHKAAPRLCTSGGGREGAAPLSRGAAPMSEGGV